MKIKEAIRWTDLAKPNAFEEELKFLWLTALEGQIAADVFLMAPAETEQFNYSYPAGLDNNAYGNFLRWFAGTYDPVQGYKKEA